MEPMAMCLRLKSLERSLEQEVQAWRNIRSQRQSSARYREVPGGNHESVARPCCVSVGRLLVEKAVAVATERVANWVVFGELHKSNAKERQAGIIKLVAEKTHTVIVERAAGHVALKRTLERERNHLRCLLERIASAYDKTTAQLGNAIFRLEGHDRHLVGLCRHIKLQMSLKQKRARQNRQRRQSMITSTLTKPKISKRGARRYSAPTAVVSPAITKASRGKVVWVPELKSWGTIQFVGQAPGKPPGQWIGVSLSLPRGNHGGKGLFPCRSEKHGHFCRASDLLEHPAEGNPRERKKSDSKMNYS